MRRYFYLPILSLIFGVAGAFFRDRQLATGFDESGLAVGGNVWAVLLVVLSAVTAVIFILFLLNFKPANSMDGTEIGLHTPVYPIICVLASAALLVAGMIGIVEYIRYETDILRNLFYQY